MTLAAEHRRGEISQPKSVPHDLMQRTSLLSATNTITWQSCKDWIIRNKDIYDSLFSKPGNIILPIAARLGLLPPLPSTAIRSTKPIFGPVQCQCDDPNKHNHNFSGTILAAGGFGPWGIGKDRLDIMSLPPFFYLSPWSHFPSFSFFSTAFR